MIVEIKKVLNWCWNDRSVDVGINVRNNYTCITFCTASRGLGEAAARPVPHSLYRT